VRPPPRPVDGDDWINAGRGMTVTTPYETTDDGQLAAALRVLDAHATSTVDGRCGACGTPGPCYRRETAVVIFSRALHAHRPRKGIGGPLMFGAHRPGGTVA